MTKTQLIFSLGIGMALMATGFALVQGGITDWGLFWTGAIISSLTLVVHIREQVTNTRQLPRLLAVTSTIGR